jgi:hypothetical protein
MRVAIMQPYFFPYLGYFQLVGAVDTFVVYDDVNFINRGWINRNNILSQGKSQRITLSLGHSSQNLHINQISVVDTKTKLLKTLVQCYAKAPQFGHVFPLLEQTLLHSDTNLAHFLHHSIATLCAHMGISSRIVLSSQLPKDSSLKGQDKLLAICDTLGASHYVNAIGGKDLYQTAAFEARGIQLSFIQQRPVHYPQFSAPFVPHLSIIDVLMFNTPEQCAQLLKEYDFV